MAPKPLTNEQVDTLIIIERVTASISVVSTLVLITTFVFIKAFRTLSNTLIFYASFANLFANVAALIGGSALGSLAGGLCQFQGFLLEMFMQSDPMWSCAMAINVYLVFFRRYDASRLKRLYWVYGLVCYGVPFIPAMFCLFYKTKAKGELYGNATLWCWIDGNWAAVRIYSYYAPVWICIFLALVIYIRVGVEIYQKRSELRAAGYSNNYTSGTFTSISDNPRAAPFTGIRTTEVEVTHDAWNKNPLSPPPQGYVRGEKVESRKDRYSITISAPTSKIQSATRFKKPVGTSMDKVKLAYTKVALLFAISILITWVPASINRVYGLRFPKNPSFALNIGSALVLPLQGFWNMVIYFSTSLGVCKSVWAEWRDTRNRREADIEGRGKGWAGMNIVHMNPRKDGAVNMGNGKDNDSMVELQRSEGSSRSADGDSF